MPDTSIAAHRENARGRSRGASRGPRRSGPGRSTPYRITVEGSLDEIWTERLGGMQILTRRRAGRKPLTTLRGPVSDQAALLGLINSLYEFGFPLLSVERLPPPSPEQTRGARHRPRRRESENDWIEPHH